MDKQRPISNEEAYEAWVNLQRQIASLRATLQELEQVSSTLLAYLPSPTGGKDV